MRQKVLSIVAIMLMLILLFLYYMLFMSSTVFEINRGVTSENSITTNMIKGLKQPQKSDSFFYNSYLQNPSNLELYIRASLLNDETNKVQLIQFYDRLLKIRPTWPYYHSGKLHIYQLHEKIDSESLSQAMRNGKYEKKVIFNLAEFLFYKWDNVNENEKFKILNILSNQREQVITGIVGISARFAKLFEYCDFLYEQKQLEYAACKQNYWQPLSG